MKFSLTRKRVNCEHDGECSRGGGSGDAAGAGVARIASPTAIGAAFDAYDRAADRKHFFGDLFRRFSHFIAVVLLGVVADEQGIGELVVDPEEAIARIELTRLGLSGVNRKVSQEIAIEAELLSIPLADAEILAVCRMNDARGGCPRAIPTPTSTSITGYGLPGSPSAARCTRSSSPTGRRCGMRRSSGPPVSSSRRCCSACWRRQRRTSG